MSRHAAAQGHGNAGHDPGTVRKHASVAQAIRRRSASPSRRPSCRRTPRAPTQARAAADRRLPREPSRRSTATSSPRWCSRLGVILFGVVTAIALLRTRARAARALAGRQAEINDLREERDRANALLHSEPQIIVVWPAGADEPEITGDVSIAIAHAAAAPRARLRHLARARQGAGDGGRGRGAAQRRQELLADADDAAAASRRGRGPRHRRPRGAAHQGPDRREERAGRARRRPSAAAPRHRHGRAAARGAALAGLGARRDRTAHLGECRLCARRRGARRRRMRSRAISRSSTRRRARTPTRARAAGDFYRGAPAGDRRRHAAHLPGDRPALARRQRRHRHRRHRGRSDARRDRPHDRGAPAHARPARDRRRDLFRRPAARILQRRLSRAVGARAGVPRFAAVQLRRARPAARRRASFPSRPISATGRASCTRPTGRSSRASTNGICPTGARCASSPRRIRKAASPTCSTT